MKRLRILRQMFYDIGEVTDQHIGVSETMITSAVAGFLYALLSGQPLIITGRLN